MNFHLTDGHPNIIGIQPIVTVWIPDSDVSVI